MSLSNRPNAATTKVCWQWVPRRRASNCESPTTIRAEAVRRYRQLMTNSRTQLKRPEHSTSHSSSVSEHFYMKLTEYWTANIDACTKALWSKLRELLQPNSEIVTRLTADNSTLHVTSRGRSNAFAQ